MDHRGLEPRSTFPTLPCTSNAALTDRSIPVSVLFLHGKHEPFMLVAHLKSECVGKFHPQIRCRFAVRLQIIQEQAKFRECRIEDIRAHLGTLHF